MKSHVVHESQHSGTINEQNTPKSLMTHQNEMVPGFSQSVPRCWQGCSPEP